MGEHADDLIDQYYNDLDEEGEYYYGRSRNSNSDFVVRTGKQKTNMNGPIETVKAVLWIMSDNEEVWIPKSQTLIKEDDRIYVTQWLASQRGWRDQSRELDKQPIEPFDLNDDIPF